MKLIRLTTTDPKAVFNSFLHQDLEIEPYSKIALGSLAVEVEEPSLIINADNHKVEVELKQGVISSIYLKFDVYDSSNYKLLYLDIESKINQALGRLTGLNKIENASEIGKTCSVFKNDAGRTDISVRQGKSSNYFASLQAGSPLKKIDSTTVNKSVMDSRALGILFSSASTHSYDHQPAGVTVTDKSKWLLSFSQDFPIARGCGIHTVQINTIADQFGEGAQGFAISLHKQSPREYLSQRTMVGDAPPAGTTSDIDFGIKLPLLNGKYSYIIDGVATESTTNCNDSGGYPNQGYYGVADNRNDTVAIEVVSGSIRFVVYRNNPGADNDTEVIVIHSIPYPIETIDGTSKTNSMELYGSYTFFGAGQITGQPASTYGCALQHVRYAPDYYSVPEAQQNTIVDDEQPVLLGSTKQTRQITAPTKHSIKFASNDISYWLGFETRRQPSGPILNNYIVSSGVDFISESRPAIAIENDCILVELNSLQVESYDAFEKKRQRVNVLSVIPYDDSNSTILHTPNNLIFLDLNNQYPIRLSSIKARLVRGDYNDLDVTGMTSMVIYISK